MNNVIHCQFGELNEDNMKCEKDCGCGEQTKTGYGIISKLEVGLVILMVLGLCALMYGVHLATGL